MRIFNIDKTYSVVCQSLPTRIAFKHEATLMINGNATGLKVKICYQNRTWEAYEYNSVLEKLLESFELTPWASPKVIKKFRKMIDNRTN